MDFTCDDLYKVLGTGAAVTLMAGFFPGAASIASTSTKSSYYYVRAAGALTSLAKRLKRSKNILWQFALSCYKMSKLIIGGGKKFVVASNVVTLARLLPFLPPVVVGIYVLFGSFWPKRILFFSAVQRRQCIAGFLYTWILALLVMILAMAINTALVDEVVQFMDDKIPLTKVTVVRKFGWHLSAWAFGFAFASVACFIIAFLILRVRI